MLVFKPRLALFYVVALVIVSFVTKRLTISTQIAMAENSIQGQIELSEQNSYQPK